MDRSTAYSLLGLQDGAAEEQIKSAYRMLAQKYNVDQYEAGPLRDEAEKHMEEINEAFDLLMSLIRTGAPEAGDQPVSSRPTPRYSAIRQLINNGQTDAALAELNNVPGGASDAEWNFLMGSAYYYKGWLEQALHYFQAAVRLDPSNREYTAALQNLASSANGEMPGNPYGAPNSDAAAMNCACNTCTLMCCMDACCGMCRGI